MFRILTSKCISNGEIFQNENFLVDGSRIVERGDSFDLGNSRAEVLNLRGLTVMPGFIDIHIHGAMGYDVMDATYEALERISTYKIEEGCTSFCPSTITAPVDKTIAAVKNIRFAMDKGLGGAKVIGAFVEGPFINPKYKGAHPEEYILPVDLNLLEKFIAAGEGCITSMIIAPELPGAVPAIEVLVKNGIQVRLGHSSASMEEVETALAAGASSAVHTFNAMSPLHHREPGMVGAVLTRPELRGELICDMVHVHAKVCRLLIEAKGSGGVALITDCMAAAGLPDGEFKLGELYVQVNEGVSRLPDGTIAGSTVTMLDCVKNLNTHVGLPLEKAVEMATSTPAKLINKYDEIGSLELGKYADIIAMDDDYNIRFVMAEGIIKKFI